MKVQTRNRVEKYIAVAIAIEKGSAGSAFRFKAKHDKVSERPCSVDELGFTVYTLGFYHKDGYEAGCRCDKAKQHGATDKNAVEDEVAEPKLHCVDFLVLRRLWPWLRLLNLASISRRVFHRNRHTIVRIPGR